MAPVRKARASERPSSMQKVVHHQFARLLHYDQIRRLGQAEHGLPVRQLAEHACRPAFHASSPREHSGVVLRNVIACRGSVDDFEPHAVGRQHFSQAFVERHPILRHEAVDDRCHPLATGDCLAHADSPRRRI